MSLSPSLAVEGLCEAGRSPPGPLSCRPAALARNVHPTRESDDTPAKLLQGPKMDALHSRAMWSLLAHRLVGCVLANRQPRACLPALSIPLVRRRRSEVR